MANEKQFKELERLRILCSRKTRTKGGRSAHTAGPSSHLVLHPEVLHEADEESWGPAVGTVQQQALGAALVCGLEVAGDDRPVHRLLRHVPVCRPLATCHHQLTQWRWRKRRYEHFHDAWLNTSVPYLALGKQRIWNR